MLYLILTLTFLFAALGMYLVIMGQLDLATSKAQKVAHTYHKNQKKVSEPDVFIETLAANISKFIRIDTYKRKKMEAELKSLNITSSPEIYKATTYVKSGLVLLGVIPSLVFVPIFSIGFLAAALIIYFKSDSDIKEQLRKRKEEIEFELPRFASTLKQELLSSRDVLTILDNYKRNAGNSMGEELEKTIADMRSGNYEAALLRFEGRISIPALSDIIRGLIGVLRGDNNVNYFDMLSHDLDVLEVQRLENIAMKQPGKIKKYLFILLMCLLAMYITILGVYTLVSVR